MLDFSSPRGSNCTGISLSFSITAIHSFLDFLASSNTVVWYYHLFVKSSDSVELTPVWARIVVIYIVQSHHVTLFKGKDVCANVLWSQKQEDCEQWKKLGIIEVSIRQVSSYLSGQIFIFDTFKQDLTTFSCKMKVSWFVLLQVYLAALCFFLFYFLFFSKNTLVSLSLNHFLQFY